MLWGWCVPWPCLWTTCARHLETAFESLAGRHRGIPKSRFTGVVDAAVALCSARRVRTHAHPVVTLWVAHATPCTFPCLGIMPDERLLLAQDIRVAHVFENQESRWLMYDAWLHRTARFMSCPRRPTCHGWQVSRLIGWCSVPSCRSTRHVDPASVKRCADAECVLAMVPHIVLHQDCSHNPEKSSKSWRDVHTAVVVGAGVKRKPDPTAQAFYGLGSSLLRSEWGLRVCPSCVSYANGGKDKRFPREDRLWQGCPVMS